MAGKNTAVFGIYPNTAALEQGVDALRLAEFRATDISVFGFFSPTGAEGTATLVAPDGTVRGTYAIRVVANVAQEFNPASSAFGAVDGVMTIAVMPRRSRET